MKPPSLFQGRRGTWIYQSPRVLLLLAYAERSGLDKQMVYERHIRRIERLGPHQSWITERLNNLGYTTRSGREPNLGAVADFIRDLSIDGERLAKAMAAVQKAVNAKSPEDLAYLPPILTLPEKVILVEALSASKKFDLEKTIRLLDIQRRPRGADPDAYRREMRFRKAYLYSLHLADPRGRPTLLGYALAYRIRRRGASHAAEDYLELMERSGRLKYVVALEVLALDVGTAEELDRVIEAYSQALGELGYSADLEATRYAFGGMKSDVKGFMIGLSRPLDWILEFLEI
ncbi:hypothetical protein [Pyrobaculum ferrireducens]|uniref:Uncharacterized protein n=1 Tax=Pyrobaculum ferrireducens TaxID=1104324 RepID=G7VBX1_9CREN|nr:hypothetical protein [Pyrobaculum ferrireducens]AET32471.1 hypothetical protein P186_1034 [Pyrobaculum ferrireducens]